MKSVGEYPTLETSVNSVQSVGVFVGGYGILPYPRHPLKSSHRIHRIHGSFWRRIFSHRFHRSTQKLVPLRGCTCLKCTSRARSAPTEQTCHLFCLCSRDSCTPWLAAWVWQGCHTLLICAHLWEAFSARRFCVFRVFCGTLSLFALLVLQRQLHQRGSILPQISTDG